MSNEIKYYGKMSESGLTVMAKLYDSAAAQVGSNIVLTEVSTLAIYLGDMPSVSAGVYGLRVFSGSGLLGQGSIVWDGNQELVDAILEGLDSITIQHVSPFDPMQSSFELIQGDDYIEANGTHVDIDLAEVDIDLNEATATVTARTKLASNCSQFSGTATIVSPDSDPKLRIEWPSAGSGAKISDDYIWQAKVVDANSKKKTEFQGSLALKVSSDEL